MHPQSTYISQSSQTGALLQAIEQGLLTEYGRVCHDDVLMELMKWVESAEHEILGTIYQQALDYALSEHYRIPGSR
ncbi:biofilm-dependent modulation protein [Salmonella enterica subsp. enterica serovar Choleraesuis]|nr:biofilm-dependent modulation protein [Salmonella enterica subsp. enterica serovar Choleraesuis]